MGNTWSQMFPPAALFTEKNLPDQTGKVLILCALGNLLVTL
jgi:hypothetical protein